MRLFFPFIFSLIIKPIIAQTTFEKAIGGTGTDVAYSLVQTANSGYVLCGSTTSFGDVNGDVYIVKTSAAGNVEWTKTVGGSQNDYGSCIITTTDGGFALCGTTRSFGAGNEDAYIIKLDSLGNVEWTKTIGGSNKDWAHSIIQTTDGGYVFTGTTRSFGPGNALAYCVKLDSVGNVIWSKRIGGDSSAGHSIVQTSDGGFTIAGTTYSVSMGGTYKVFIFKLDASGNLIWNNIIGGDGESVAYSIIQTNDGGLVAAGYTYPFMQGKCAFAVKVDSNGFLVWTKSICGLGEDYFQSVIEDYDQGLILCGATYSFTGINGDAYVVKLSENGNLLWTKALGAYHEHGTSIIKTDDGGFALCGLTFIIGDSLNFYIAKLDSTGNTCSPAGNVGTVSTMDSTHFSTITVTSPTSIEGSGGIESSGGVVIDYCLVTLIEEDVTSDELILYPNPATDNIFLYNPSLTFGEGEIFDCFGKKLLHFKLNNRNSIDISQLNSGIYFLKTRGEFQEINLKFIKLE